MSHASSFFHCHEHTRELSKKKHNLFYVVVDFVAVSSSYHAIIIHHILSEPQQHKHNCRYETKPSHFSNSLVCLLTQLNFLTDWLVWRDMMMLLRMRRGIEMLRWRTKKSWVFRGWAFSPFSSFARDTTLLLYFWCSCAAMFIFM